MRNINPGGFLWWPWGHASGDTGGVLGSPWHPPGGSQLDSKARWKASIPTLSQKGITFSKGKEGRNHFQADVYHRNVNSKLLSVSSDLLCSLPQMVAENKIQQWPDKGKRSGHWSLLNKTLETLCFLPCTVFPSLILPFSLTCSENPHVDMRWMCLVHTQWLHLCSEIVFGCEDGSVGQDIYAIPS